MGRNCSLLEHNDEVKDLDFIFENFGIKYIDPLPNLKSRCTICNGILNELDNTIVSNPIHKNILEKVYKSIPTIYRFSKCSKIYWDGTHVQSINLFMGKINYLLRQ